MNHKFFRLCSRLTSIRHSSHPHTSVVSYIFHYTQTWNSYYSQRQTMSNFTPALSVEDITLIRRKSWKAVYLHILLRPAANLAVALDSRSSRTMCIDLYEMRIFLFLLSAPDVTAIISPASYTSDVHYPYPGPQGAPISAFLIPSPFSVSLREKDAKLCPLPLNHVLDTFPNLRSSVCTCMQQVLTSSNPFLSRQHISV